MLKTVKKLAHGVGICTNIKVDKSVYVDTSNRVCHYARVDSGVVTAKLGPAEMVQHSDIYQYFDQSYGDYNAFYTK